MRVTITLLDTKQGIKPVFRWDPNGVCDNPMDSISMHLALSLARQIESQEKAGYLKCTMKEKEV